MTFLLLLARRAYPLGGLKRTVLPDQPRPAEEKHAEAVVFRIEIPPDLADFRERSLPEGKPAASRANISSVVFAWLVEDPLWYVDMWIVILETAIRVVAQDESDLFRAISSLTLDYDTERFVRPGEVIPENNLEAMPLLCDFHSAPFHLGK